MKRPQSILLSSVLIASLVSFSLGWFFAKNIGIWNYVSKNSLQTLERNNSETNTSLKIRDIDEVWKTLSDSYYDPTKLKLSELEFGAVKGFVKGIGDEYTVFMTPDESKEFENGLEGQLEGIGAQLEVKSGKLVVVSPLKNSPAERAGIRAGDIILSIDGKIAADMTFYEAIQSIRGKKGTSVTLKILRENIPVEIEIKRAEITVDTITIKKLNDDIFHVSINQFNDHTKSEFQNVIQKILLEKAKGMILDVRGNGGGFLDIAVDIVSEFIPGKQPAVVIKKRDATKTETIKTHGNAKLPDIPVVVLVNRGSASASEIVAGSLQDYKRAIIIGERTFGKGSVQEITKLTDGSSLRLTIAKWFTPRDRSIDDVGIIPDREVKMTEEDIKQNRDPQLEEAVEYLKNLTIRILP